jgi:hypothetical protein
MQFTAEPLLDEEGVPLAVLTADTQAAIDELRAAARAAAEASRAPSSERAYAADWRRRHEAEFSKHVKDRRIGSRIEQTTSDRIIFCSKTEFGSQGASRARRLPPGWEHIRLTGDYHWETAALGPDQFRPLRTRADDLA